MFGLIDQFCIGIPLKYFPFDPFNRITSLMCVCMNGFIHFPLWFLLRLYSISSLTCKLEQFFFTFTIYMDVWIHLEKTPYLAAKTVQPRLRDFAKFCPLLGQLLSWFLGFAQFEGWCRDVCTLPKQKGTHFIKMLLLIFLFFFNCSFFWVEK